MKNEFTFFMPMREVPTVTDQHHRFGGFRKDGRAIVYDDAKLKEAKRILTEGLSRHRQQPLKGPVRLVVKWCFPITGSGKSRRKDGEYKATKPDTDNLDKALKDCMTKLGFWKDDAQVASEIIEKFYAERTGVFVHAEEIYDDGNCAVIDGHKNGGLK